MASIYTSAFCKTQLTNISQALIDNRGVSHNEEINYNGIKYIAGDLMGSLRKDYEWWSEQYNKALISEGNSDEIDIKLVKGIEW